MKKQIFKKALASLLAAVMLAALMPGSGFEGSSKVFAEEEPETSGECGVGVSWSYGDGTLTITGNGEMTDYNFYGVEDDNVPPYSVFASEVSQIIIQQGVTAIGSHTFENFPNLTDVSIPSSVRRIGRYAFSGCPGLKSIEIPDEVTEIEWHAFENCSGLTSINLPSKMREIDEYVFSGCTSLESVDIPQGVESILERAFKDCSSLKSIKLPSSLTSLGRDYGDTFSGCTSLKSIYIPKNVSYVSRYGILQGCTNLTSIKVDEENPYYDSRDNCNAIINTNTDELVAGCSETVIPTGVISITNSAFRYCTGLKSIEIPPSVDTIGDFAFQGCTGLTGIDIPSSVTSVGTCAFNGCSSLASMTISENMTEIPDNFANYSGLESVEIPSGITKIDSFAFEECPNLTSVWIPSSVTTIGYMCCGYCPNLTDVYYEGSEEDWNNISIDQDNGMGDTIYWYEGSPNMTLHYNSSMDGGDDDVTVFRIPEDTNFFNHSYDHFFYCKWEDAEDWDLADKARLKLYVRLNRAIIFDDGAYVISDSLTNMEPDGLTYPMSQDYLDRLASGLDPVSAYFLKDRRNDAWGGSCHGIAVSMALASAGILGQNEGVHGTYHDSGIPKANVDLRDTINFYQMSQYTTRGMETESTYNPSWDLSSDGKSLKTFLKDLVDESLKCKKQKRPFVFSFGYTHEGEDEGHSIIVYGVTKLSDDQYSIRMYDENDNKQLGCFVDLAEETFGFTDGNGTHITNTHYNYLNFTGMKRLYHSVALMEESDPSEEGALLTLTAGKKCTVTNDRGEYLSYDGESYSGNMNVYSQRVAVGGRKQTLILRVDPYESLTMTDCDSRTEVTGEIADEYYTATVEGADSVTFTDGSVELMGTDYSFSAGTSAGLQNDNLYKVSTDANGDVLLTAKDGIVNVDAQNPMANTVITTLGDNTTDYQETTSDTQSITINTADGGSDIEIIPAAQTDIANCSVTIDPSEIKYDGYAWEPWVYVYYGERELAEGTDFTVEFADNVNAGTARVIVTGRGDFTGTTEAMFTITKAANKITKVTASKKIKYAKLKKKTQTFKIAATVKGKAKKTFKLKTVPKKAKKYIKVSSAGKVTVRKGLKKGTYKIKVQITAAATKNYKKTAATKTVKVVVK